MAGPFRGTLWYAVRRLAGDAQRQQTGTVVLPFFDVRASSGLG